jgi:oligopeptide transport system substrate-binding protein
MEYLQAQWQAILGVSFNLHITDRMTYAASDELFVKGQAAMSSSGWLADYPDPDSFLRGLVTKHIGWKNTVFDQLVEAASHVSEHAERLKLYQAADRIFIEEAVILPLLYGRDHFLVKPWISHFHSSPLRTWHWKEVVIEPH